MAKKKAATVPDADVQAAEEILTGILQELDNFGCQLVEANWRAMTETENNQAVAWLASRRIGKKSPLPLCLIQFASAELKAEQEKYLERQDEGRSVLAMCVFRRPSFDKDEDGNETTKLAFQVADSKSGGYSGSTALELLGKTRVRAEFSRRPVGEWGPGLVDEDIVQSGPRRIVVCETEIPSFGWSDNNWKFAFLIPSDLFSLEDAIAIWKKQGSIRLTVLGQAVADPGPVQVAQEPKRPGRPKKSEAEKPAGRAIPGTTPSDLAETYNVALTDRYKLEVAVLGQPDGRFSCKWVGEGPAGSCEQGEPSVRASETEAIVAAVGNAVDHWAAYADDESKTVIDSLKRWLRELDQGKTPKLIEAESFADE